MQRRVTENVEYVFSPEDVIDALSEKFGNFGADITGMKFFIKAELKDIEPSSTPVPNHKGVIRNLSVSYSAKIA